MDPSRVREGLRLAMRVGLPPEAGLRPRFWVPSGRGVTAGVADGEGVPLDPSVDHRAESGRYVDGVLCALEYTERPGVQLDWTQVLPSVVTVTVLDEEYRRIKGFTHMLIGGEKFKLRNENMPLGLGAIGVHQFVVVAEDDG